MGDEMRFVGSAPTRRGQLPSCRVRPGGLVREVSEGEVVAVEREDGRWFAARVVEVGESVVRVRFTTPAEVFAAAQAAKGDPAGARLRTRVFSAAVPLAGVRVIEEAL